MENINERRLRPVFDNLELGNNKKAIQEAEKVLKKNPTIQCARALKALALLRIGREEEADKLEKELIAEKPCDVSTLQVMTFYYRETEELNKICALYNNAVSVCPGNEELMSHLFMSYVRINDYKQQQIAALQLYKFRQKNPYYFWAVMSVVLQALRGPEAQDKSKSKTLLVLAQRMVDKLIKEDKLDAEQEVELYLSILKYQEKYEEALEFFDGALCKKLYPGVPITFKIEMYKNLKRWEDLHQLLKKLLLQEHDRWDYYQEFIATCFELKNQKKDEKDAESFLTQCSEFIKHIIEIDKKVRGPLLAQLELHRRMRADGLNADELLGDYMALLVHYYHTFGDLICCTNDLKLFLEYLDADKRPGFASKLLQECGISSTTLPENKNQMQKHLCALQISRICGAHAALSTEHLSALCTALSLHYEHGMSAFGNELLATDIGPSDPYALLAVNVMYDLSQRSQSSERLVEALYLLNYLLYNSPSNFHAKLLCLQFYHLLGCGTGAQNVLQSLDVKHIQLDSMGYLHCAHLPSAGIPSVARYVYDSTQKFFQSSQKDTLEYLAMSYKFGSFSKLQEFMKFRDRLSNSYHYALTLIELQLLELVSFTGSVKQNVASFKNLCIKHDDDRIQWDQLSDNRDLGVMLRWDPAYPFTNEAGDLIEPEALKDKLKEMESDSFVQDVELLQIRVALARIVACAIELMLGVAPSDADAKDVPPEKLHHNQKVLKILKDHWQELFNRISKMNYKPTSNKYLVNLLPSRLHSVLQLPYDTVFAELMEFVIDLWDGNKQAESVSKKLIAKFKEISDMMSKSINDHNAESDPFWNRKTVQTKIVGCIEILSLCSLVLSTCHDKYASQSQTHSRKGKKKDIKQNQNGVISTDLMTEADKICIVVETIKELKLALSNCDKALDTWKPPVIKASLVESLSALSLTPTVEAIVSNNFSENHTTIVKDMKQILKEKIKITNK